MIMAPESGELTGMTEQYFETVYSDELIRSKLGSLAYHSYWGDNYVHLKEAFGKTVDSKYSDIRVDMTEWCELPCWHDKDDLHSAIVMARVIANDMQLSHPSSWTCWVAVNQNGYNEEDGKNYSDGLMTATDDFSEYSVNARYYALAHFSKYVPAGSVLLDVHADRSTLVTEIDGSVEDENDPKHTKTNYSLNYAGFLTPDGKTVLVLVNEGDTRTVRLDVKSKNMTVITTDDSHRLSQTYSGKKLGKIELKYNSITTVIFD